MTQLEIHNLDGSRAERAFALASLSFATQSVLHATLGADLEEYRAYPRPTFFDGLGDGLSLMATDPESGDLMGILVVRDFRKQRFAGELPYQERYDRISALFVDMAAVPSAHAGKGIYQALRTEISIRAKSLATTRSSAN